MITWVWMYYWSPFTGVFTSKQVGFTDPYADWVDLGGEG